MMAVNLSHETFVNYRDVVLLFSTSSSLVLFIAFVSQISLLGLPAGVGLHTYPHRVEVRSLTHDAKLLTH